MQGFSKLFKFNLYVYNINKKKQNSLKKYHKYEDLFFQSSIGARTKTFLTSFFYFLYNFFKKSQVSTKKILFHFIGFKRGAAPLKLGHIYRLVKRTGNFFTQVWMPGIITNFNIAKWSLSRYSIPAVFYTRVGMIVLSSPDVLALREARNFYIPALVLSYCFPGVLVSTNDFTYFFSSIFYSIWYISLGHKLPRYH